MNPTQPADAGRTLIARTPMKIFGIGRACYDPDPTKTGDPTPPPTPPADKKEDKKEPTEADKIQAAIDKALETERASVAAEAKKKADAAAIEEAKKKGDWEKLAADEKTRAEAAEAKAKKLQAEIELREHLTETYPEYITAAKWILPTLDMSLDAAALTKAIEKGCAAYVKDNQKTPTGSGGMPPRQGGNRQGPPTPPPDTAPRRRFGHLSWRG